MKAVSAALVFAYTVVVAAPADMIARSARIHSYLVLDSDADPLFRLDAQSQKPGCQQLHSGGGVSPGDRRPFAAPLVAKRRFR